MAILLLATMAFATAFILPAYVEYRLIPRLAEGFGLAPEEAGVRRIGWWGADLGPLRFNAGDATAITVEAIQIDYSPWSLLQGEIKGIALAGLGMELTVTDDGISVAGLKPPPKSATGRSGPGAIDVQTLLPVKLGRFSILQSQLHVRRNRRRCTIPFDIHLQTRQLADGILKGRTHLSMLGNPITLTMNLEQPANRAELTVEAQGFVLESLYQLGLLPKDIKMAGTTDLEGLVRLELSPLTVTGFSLSAIFPDARLTAPDGTLHNLAGEMGRPRPIELAVTGDNLSKIQWRCAPFHIRSQLSVAVNALQGQWRQTGRGWSLEAAITSVAPAQKMRSGMDLKNDLVMNWLATVHKTDPDQPIQFDLQGKGRGPWAASKGEHAVSGLMPSIKITGHVQKGALSADGGLAARNIRVQFPGGKMAAAAFKLNGHLAANPLETGLTATIEALAELSKVRADAGSTAMHIPQIHFNAKAHAKPNHPWRLDARLKLANAGIQDSPNSVKASNLTIDLPLRWPDAAGSPKGRLSIDAVQWQKHQLGGLKGTLQQHTQGLKLALRHRSKLFPGMNVFIKGGIDAAGGLIQLETPPYEPDAEIDLGRFNPSAAGVMAGGRLAAEGTLIIDKAGAKGKAWIKLNQGRLHQESKHLSLKGMDMTLQIDDVIRMKSAPKQKLRIGQLAFGNLEAQNLDVDFQLEGKKTLFIEKAGIEWSRGKINTSAIRIIAGKADYDVTLFCDRLNLAMVLEQLGDARADGEGTVNGRIPIRWHDGRLSFDNGFLYSTPGQTGAIQLSGTQALLAGLPPGTPQHTQLDIATEALKDYTYKWAKLNVRSEDDILLLKLQFDGKPNRLLPFAYDQSLGQFKRISGAGQADFKGIGIDLNLRSPLNDIINYRELLKQQ